VFLIAIININAKDGYSVAVLVKMTYIIANLVQVVFILMGTIILNALKCFHLLLVQNFKANQATLMYITIADMVGMMKILAVPEHIKSIHQHGQYNALIMRVVQ
jgi:hypothetical protein